MPTQPLSVAARAEASQGVARQTVVYPHSMGAEVFAPISGVVRVVGVPPGDTVNGKIVNARILITGDDGTNVYLDPVSVTDTGRNPLYSRINEGALLGLASTSDTLAIDVQQDRVYIDALKFLAGIRPIKKPRTAPGTSQQVEQPVDEATPQAAPSGAGILVLLAGAAFFFLRGKGKRK